MKNWNSFPLLRILPLFLVGVVGTAFLIEVLPWANLGVVSIILFVVSSGVLLTGFGAVVKSKSVFGILAFMLMLICGAGLTLSVSNHLYPENISAQKEWSQFFLARIVDEPQLGTKSVKVEAEISSTDLRSFGRVLLYFPKDSVSQTLGYGDEIVVKSNLQPVENLGNPNEFNYKRYLRFNGINFRGYVKASDYQVLSSNNFSLRGCFFGIRSRLIDKLKEANLTGNELAVASALILGYRTDLDKELMSAYAGAGATHVLAVSGLHVGIVYVILNTFLRFMDRRRSLKIAKTVLLIFILFGYAALTGLSASVFRAATMFSFVAIGQAIKRDTNIFNTLAASAFCLIAYEPMIVMQVGFQLSYAAVLGIVIIQPRLFKLLTFENRFLDWAWSITCVSVAAQIATFPLGLLYFHQFPNLFLVSNLVVIPAAAGILYLGFSLFVFGFWKPALLYFGFLLNSLITIINQIVMWIESIPYSVLTGIDISTIESLMIYLTIVLILVFIVHQKPKPLYGAFVLAIVFVGMQIFEVYQQKSQRFATVYNVKEGVALALVEGNHVNFFSSKSFYENEQAMLFHIRHHWWNRGVESELFFEISDFIMNRRINWGDVSFAIVGLDSPNPIEVGLKDRELDFVCLSDVSWSGIEQVQKLGATNIYVPDRFGRKKKEKLLAETTNADIQFINAAILAVSK